MEWRAGNQRWWQFKGRFKGADHLTFEKGRGRYGWFQKKISCRLISSEKKILQGNTRHTVALDSRENKFYYWRFAKKTPTQTKSPITPVKTQMVGPYLIKFLGLLAGPAEQFSKCGGRSTSFEVYLGVVGLFHQRFLLFENVYFLI